jgi:phage shock protein A
MNLFRRIFKIGQAEAHSLVDQLEDPIKLTEQGIRDMKLDLEKSLHALAEVKAMAIRARQEAELNRTKGAEYEQKAMQLLERAEQGAIDPAEADRLATQALTKKEECAQTLARATADATKFEDSITKLDANIKKLRANISKWENEAKTLKARAKVSEATKNVNKALSQIDGSGTVSMLEKMKEKVEKDEALAESYADIANESRSVDDEIDKVLNTSSTSSSEALAALKAKMAQKNAQ